MSNIMRYSFWMRFSVNIINGVIAHHGKTIPQISHVECNLGQDGSSIIHLGQGIIIDVAYFIHGLLQRIDGLIVERSAPR